MDRKTVLQAQRGDAGAQAALLRNLGGLVGALVRRLGARHELEDQLHDVFVHLLEALPQFDVDGPAKLSTWAFTVTQRWLLMQRRRAAPNLVALDGGLSVPSEERDATEHVQGRQLLALLEAELARLPEEQRRAFVSTQLHAQPLPVVADVEGVPLATLKTRLHRARATLVLRLGPLLERATHEGGRHAAAR
ncbi:MAG: RNA polymerase sigma factor [Myxococcota bacterium]